MTRTASSWSSSCARALHHHTYYALLGHGPDQAFQGDAQRFSAWALEDAASIASF